MYAGRVAIIKTKREGGGMKNVIYCIFMGYENILKIFISTPPGYPEMKMSGP